MTRQQLLDLIDDFQKSVLIAVSEFYKIYNRKDLLRTWIEGTIPRQGKLNDVVKEFSFHGCGLRATLKDKEINFDFGPNDRIDGFDAGRLICFANSQKKYERLFNLKDIEQGLDQLKNAGVITKPETSPGRSNYYLTRTNSH